ncbi:macro domain-containing protein [Gracilibacillus sp. YIM 98692]|uniref:macro domain-containing protein n=1 Tax=Gracilibacillus sp. YIM 98692 TaxID=2663532 RepID=UPI0013D03C9F|nr:macro domain-containing protein [Gracilibacillus sp. YIM 98692]
MKIKVNFFDKSLWKRYFSVLSIVSVIMSFVLIGVDIPDEDKLTTMIVLFLVLIITYLLMWAQANRSDDVTLNINNSSVRIKVGDIFEDQEYKKDGDEESPLKVVAFNEYFDTQVDNRIISKRTLNGRYINEQIYNIEEFDRSLDSELAEKMIGSNENRKAGKKKKYKLGTIFQHGNYLLTAFSKFDDDNRAHLHMNDYINFLINFWNEVDIVYGGRTVVIPLLGSGMTRFKGYDMVSEQELLELLIWSFKVSRIKFKHPAHVCIVIHKSSKDKINFYKLRSVENGL